MQSAMNFIIHKNVLHKIRIIPRKLSTSQASIENPPSIHERGEKFFLHFDPVNVFSEWTASRAPTIEEVKRLHGKLIRLSMSQSDIFVANSLLNWYLKLSGVEDARKLFDKVLEPNVISWNIMISGHNENLMFGDSWKYFCQMHSMVFVPNQYTYGSILLSCSALGSDLYAQLVHATSIRNGYYSNGYVRAGLIDLFGKSCRADYALKVFYDCPDDENVVCWNSVISAAVKGGDYWAALEVFSQMYNGSLFPNNFAFSSALTACKALEESDFGRRIHGMVVKLGARKDVFVGTALVDLYSKHGYMDEAVRQFRRMPSRNVVSWTVIISGFVQKDDYISALQFFREMTRLGEEVNEYTITSIITASFRLADKNLAAQVHSWIMKTGLYLISAVRFSLITMYTRIGEVDSSKTLFLEAKNVEDTGLWAVMISALAQNQGSYGAAELFHEMLLKGLKPDKFSASSVLSVIDSLDLGKQIHSFVLKIGLLSDVSVGSALSTMYSKCGLIEESYRAFEQISNKDVVSWGSMIWGFSEHGYAEKSIQLFRNVISLDKIRPDQNTLTGVLVAFIALGNLLSGKEVHGYVLRSGMGRETPIGGALVNMYSKFGALEHARRVFDMVTHKDQILCSALISGYAQKGFGGDALKMFLEMLKSNLQVDSCTVSSAVGAALLEEKTGIGKQLHALIVKLGFYAEVSTGSSLITMYSKLGEIENCYKVFKQIENPDLVGWTTMINSYAQHGKAKEALSLYEVMTREGVRPDSVTFVAVLLACSHVGLVEEGYFHLNSMIRDYGIEPALRHYACMVDLLSRSGRLREAEDFISKMPIEPDALIWGTLLAACRVHGDDQLGHRAAKKILDLKPRDPEAYISLSNIQADLGKWDEVLEVRSLMKGTTVTKVPGWSYL